MVRHGRTSLTPPKALGHLSPSESALEPLFAMAGIQNEAKIPKDLGRRVECAECFDDVLQPLGLHAQANRLEQLERTLITPGAPPLAFNL